MANNREYKRTYEGDYSKSYKDYTTWKKQGEVKKREYEAISKKIDDQPYIKSEKSEYVAGTRPKKSERVNAQGGGARHKDDIKRNWNKNEVYTSQMSEDQKYAAKRHKKEEGEKTTTTGQDFNEFAPTYDSPKEESQRNKNVYEEAVEVEEEDDGNYNHYDYPLLSIGINKYRNVKTNQEVDENGAREILKTAGYMPKSSSNIGTVIFLFVLANIMFAMIAPIIAIGYGVVTMGSSKTTWAKGTSSGVYKYSLQATAEEKALRKKIGQFCIVAGVISAFIHYRFLF